METEKGNEVKMDEDRKDDDDDGTLDAVGVVGYERLRVTVDDKERDDGY